MEDYLNSKRRNDMYLYLNKDIMNSFSQYGSFLDGIPNEFQSKEAKDLIWVLVDYGRGFDSYDATYKTYCEFLEEGNQSKNMSHIKKVVQAT